MSILETLASLATAKAVAAAAATTLAVGGAAGLTIAQDHADDEASVPDEVPVGEGGEHRAENADLRAGNAEGRAGTEQETDTTETDTTEVDTTEVDTQDDAEHEGRAGEVHASLTAGGELTPKDGAAFGQAVADNARDGEPGAFGRSVADEARSGAGEDRRDEAGSDVEATDQREEAKERRPAAEDRRPADKPAEGEGSESRVDGETTADDNRNSDRPGSAGAEGRP